MSKKICIQDETSEAGPSGMSKKSVFSVQNFVKEEPSSNGTQRLQSFRVPRDLSLGGTKPKKVYTPNLNVARLKNKPKEIVRKESKKTSRSHQTRQDAKPSLSSNKFIQTQGVFSEGSGEIRTQHGHSDNASYRQHESMPVPKIRKKSLQVKDMKKEDAVVDTLLQDNESEEEDEEEDIYEPLVLSGEMFMNQLDSKADVKMEKELGSGSEQKANVKQEDCEYKFLQPEQYSDNNLTFSLIQFPDSLAGRGGSEDPNDKNLDFKLRNVAEGQIGNIIIRKSGKMQLQIGQKFYDFEVAKRTDFSQDIVAVVTEGEQTKLGKIGTIDAEYQISPEWKRLFEK